MKIEITQEALDCLNQFELPKDITFGHAISPVMAIADYEDGKWKNFKLLPYGNISLAPTAKVLHYGQEIFEGMKAFSNGGKDPILFRPDQNADRFNFSAKRMAMPDVPKDLFLSAVKAVTFYSKKFIPSRAGDSLYLRPFMFATEESLGIKPSEKFKFLVIASPSGPYFQGGSIRVLIERNRARAFPGGTGAAKTGGNYAASLQSSKEAKDKGHHQTLWLDASQRKYIEELSGMNFFCVVNGEIYTPKLTDTILDGITRRSIIDLARKKEMRVHEVQLEINWVLSKIKSRECTEVFACGTAVVITPISDICDINEINYQVPETFGPISRELREELVGIQEGKKEGPENWAIKVTSDFLN